MASRMGRVALATLLVGPCLGADLRREHSARIAAADAASLPWAAPPRAKGDLSAKEKEHAEARLKFVDAARAARNLTAPTAEDATRSNGATRSHGVNGTDTKRSAKMFGTCTQACDQCFNDHFQGCLAVCHKGCEDYCQEKLPSDECLKKQKWTATVGHAIEALSSESRMCKSTGFNGCPDPLPEATPPPFDPYTVVKHDELEKDGKKNDPSADPNADVKSNLRRRESELSRVPADKNRREGVDKSREAPARPGPTNLPPPSKQK